MVCPSISGTTNTSTAGAPSSARLRLRRWSLVGDVDAADEVLLPRVDLGAIVVQRELRGLDDPVGFERSLADGNQPRRIVDLTTCRVTDHREAARELALDDIFADRLGIHTRDAEPRPSQIRLDEQRPKGRLPDAARPEVNVHTGVMQLKVRGVLDEPGTGEAETSGQIGPGVALARVAHDHALPIRVVDDLCAAPVGEEATEHRLVIGELQRCSASTHLYAETIHTVAEQIEAQGFVGRIVRDAGAHHRHRADAERLSIAAGLRHGATREHDAGCSQRWRSARTDNVSGATRVRADGVTCRQNPSQPSQRHRASIPNC